MAGQKLHHLLLYYTITIALLMVTVPAYAYYGLKTSEYITLNNCLNYQTTIGEVWKYNRNSLFCISGNNMSLCVYTSKKNVNSKQAQTFHGITATVEKATRNALVMLSKQRLMNAMDEEAMTALHQHSISKGGKWWEHEDGCFAITAVLTTMIWKGLHIEKHKENILLLCLTMVGVVVAVYLYERFYYRQREAYPPCNHYHSSTLRSGISQNNAFALQCYGKVYSVGVGYWSTYAIRYFLYHTSSHTSKIAQIVNTSEVPHKKYTIHHPITGECLHCSKELYNSNYRTIHHYSFSLYYPYIPHRGKL